MADWRVDIHALNAGSPLVTGLPVQDWMFNYVLNAPGAFEADMYIGAAGVTESNLEPGAREIKVYRKSENLLTEPQSSDETTPTGWTATGAPGFVDTGRTAVSDAVHGGFIHRISESAGGAPAGNIRGIRTNPPASGVVAAAPGDVFTMSGYFRTRDRDNTEFRFQAVYQDAAFAGIITHNLTGLTIDMADGWTRFSFTLPAAPANTAWVDPRWLVVGGATPNARYDFDAMQIQKGSVATFFELGGGGSEVLVWGGYLWNRVGDVRTKTVKIQGEGYYSRLRRRLITADLIYTDANVQQVMWNLINHVQSKTHGNMGFSQGTHVGGNRTVDADFCALDYPLVAEGIDGLTAMDDGCDWIITPSIGLTGDKNFRTWQPRKSTDLSSSIVFTQDNLFNLNYETNAMDLATWLNYVGPGDCNPREALIEDTSLQATYGLLETVVETDEFDGMKDLKSHGRDYFRNYKRPRDLAEAVYYEGDGPAWGDFQLGDIVKLQSNQGMATINRNMRVLGFQAEMNRNAVNFFQVTLDSVVD